MAPEISRFYGIKITMRLQTKEHNPPHIHAIYAEHEASFSIKDAKIIGDGKFPPKGKKMVVEFIKKNQKELLEIWEKGNYRKLPPIK